MADELRKERLILFERGGSILRTTDQFFNKVGIQPSLALESNDTSFIKLMVERGLGVSLLPAWAVRDEVAWGWLSKLRIEGHRLRRTVAVISLAGFQPAATRAFLEYRPRPAGRAAADGRGPGPRRRAEAGGATPVGMAKRQGALDSARGGRP